MMRNCLTDSNGLCLDANLKMTVSTIGGWETDRKAIGCCLQLLGSSDHPTNESKKYPSNSSNVMNPAILLLLTICVCAVKQTLCFNVLYGLRKEIPVCITFACFVIVDYLTPFVDYLTPFLPDFREKWLLEARYCCYC